MRLYFSESRLLKDFPVKAGACNRDITGGVICAKALLTTKTVQKIKKMCLLLTLHVLCM